MISGTNASKQKKSPYITFSRESWKELRNSTPLTLKTSDLEEIRGLNENISLDEVVDIYLPLSRLLHLYYRAARELYAARREFLGTK